MTDKVHGKPPLANKGDTSSTREQNQRTQKSFRITKGGKRGGGNQTVQVQNALSRKY